MSVGSIIGGIVGGIVGWFVGGPWGVYWGIMIGAGLGGIVDPIAPDIPTPGRLDTSELSISTAEEGLPIAEIFGSPKLTGNIIGYWNSRSEEVKEEVQGGKGGGGSQSVTSGYKYYLTWLMGLCIGPVDTLYAIYQNDKCIWEGELERPVSGGEQTIVISDLGSVTFYYGTDDQAINTTVQGLVDDPTLVPSYRHQCCAFFDDCFIGERNTLPTFRFVIKKNVSYSFNSIEVTIESYDYNPAHAIYHILYNLVNLNSSFFNEDSFNLVAKNLYCENLGINILMDKQAGTLAYLEQILYHIKGILIFNNKGEFELKLIRKDKATNLLPIIDETMMLDDLQFERKSWINTFNEIKIQHPLRYFVTEVNGEAIEGDGQGNCSLSPTLNYIGCVEESYFFYETAGKYSITDGCGPFILYYKDENMSAFKKVKNIYGREFTYLCRSIVCAGNGEDREIKLFDKGNDLWSNTLNIAVTEAPVFGLTAGPFEVNAGSSAIVSLAGGKPPYNWRITGSNIYFDSAKTKQEIDTVSTSVTVYADDFDDLSDSKKSGGGSVILNVSDGCISLDSGSIDLLTCCTELPDGTFIFDYDNTPDTITAGSNIDVYIDGGCGPYIFTTSSKGYHFGGGEKQIESSDGIVTLYCNSGDCGIDYDPDANINVIDSCNKRVSGSIRNTSGAWVAESECCPGCGVCIQLPPEGDCSNHACSGEEYILGKERWVTNTQGDFCYDGGYPSVYQSGCTSCISPQPPAGVGEAGFFCFIYYHWSACS